MSDALGRRVEIGNLKISLFSGGASAEDVVIMDDAAFSKDPFVTAKSIRLESEVRSSGSGPAGSTGTPVSSEIAAPMSPDVDAQHPVAARELQHLHVDLA